MSASATHGGHDKAILSPAVNEWY